MVGVAGQTYHCLRHDLRRACSGYVGHDFSLRLAGL
jgi:hypothetical protein